MDINFVIKVKNILDSTWTSYECMHTIYCLWTSSRAVNLGPILNSLMQEEIQWLTVDYSGPFLGCISVATPI